MIQAKLDGRQAWTVAGLLFVSQIVNYFDKNVMGLAAPAIMQELHLTSEQYGFVASSFFALYAVAGVSVGLFVAHRVPSKPLIAVLVLIWSVAQLPIVFVPTLTVLVLGRVMLGIGEGPASPTATSAALEWFSSDNRNMPTALLMLGSSLGSVIAGPALSYVMDAHGWRAGFLLCSVLGLAWLALWLAFGASAPRIETSARDDVALVPVVPQSKVWRDPTILTSIVVGFCAYWVVGFALAWLAPFIRLGLGFDARSTGWIVSANAVASSVCLLTISYASQRMLKRGRSSRVARGCVNATCLALSALAFAAAALAHTPAIKLLLLAMGGAFPLLTFTLGPAMVSEIVPPRYRSRLLITIYAGITIAGFLAPLVAGRLIGDRGIAGYDAALMVNAGVVLFGAIVAAIGLNPERSRARLNPAPRIDS